MRILVLSPEIPFPPFSGGRIRTCHLLRALALRYELTLVGFSYGKIEERPQFPIDVISVPWERPELYEQMECGDSIASVRAAEKLTYEIDEPGFASVLESPAMEATLREVGGKKFDAVLIEHTNMGRFLHCLPPGVPKILDLHNVYSLMARRSL